MVTFLIFTILYPEKYLWLIWKESPASTLINIFNFAEMYLHTLAAWVEVKSGNLQYAHIFFGMTPERKCLIPV